jgi:hypothetical protein
MSTCPACGVEHPSEKKFCPACGARLVEASPPSTLAPPLVATVTCLGCGTSVPANAKFCRSCGRALAAVTIDPPPDAFPPAVETKPEASRRSVWVVGSALVAAMLLAGGTWYLLTSRRAVVSGLNETVLSSRLSAQPPADVKPESVPTQTPESIANTPDAGSKPIVQGPVDETAVGEAPRRGEAEHAAQAQPGQDGAGARLQDARPGKVEVVAPERRLAPARETEVRQTEADAEPRREDAARDAETNKAAADEQQRREDAAWAAAAETARRRQPEEPAVQAIEVPAGTEINVRLSTKLNSGRVHVEDRFEATTQDELKIGGRTVVPAGSVMRGIVSSVEPASRTNRTARMTLAFDQLTVNGQAYPIRSHVTQAIAGEGLKGEATKIAVGAGLGAVIGGLLGGAKGVAAGTVIGGGGTVAATDGKQVELSQGTVLRTSLDAPVQIQIK